MSGAAQIIGAAATLVSAGVSTYSAMSAKSPKATKVADPVLKPVAVAPVADDATLAASRKQAVMRRQQASGRQSTILTDTETLGG